MSLTFTSMGNDPGTPFAFGPALVAMAGT